MIDALLGAPSLAYAAVMVGGFGAVALWETLAPAREPQAPLGRRWLHNVGLLALGHLLLVAVLPMLPLAAAWQARQQGWGLLHLVPLPAAAPLLVTVPLTVLLLDAARWALHRAFHHAPWLWRLHRVHHSDIDYDCSIGLRFHPLEALLGSALLVALVLALGLPPLGVLVSDLLTIALGYLAHANASLPPRWEHRLRGWLVTPDVHRVHHSTRLAESQCNFGSVLVLWDRLAGSWRARAEGGTTGMAIGLAEWRDPAELGFWRLLAMPAWPLQRRR